jgi:uncharacterized protein (TIGR03067 family)
MMFKTPSKRRQAAGLLAVAALAMGVALQTGPIRAADGASQKDAKDEIQLFKGSWDVARVFKDGTEIPEDFLKEIKLSFSGANIVILIQDMQKKATITIDSAKKPKEIDLKFEDAQETAHGIYEFAGDTVKIHASESKEQRPKDFKGDAPLIIVLKRPAVDKDAKKDKKGDRAPTAANSSLRDVQGKAEKHPLQATWTITSGTKGGMELPADLVGKIKLTFDGGDKLTVEVVEAGIKTGTFKVDDKAKPRQIDLVIDGKTVLGIYEVTADTLKICHSEQGGPRPTDFKAEAGTPNAVMVLRREKTEKAEKKTGRGPTAADSSLILAYGDGQDKKADKSDKDFIQGVWQVESIIDDGMPFPDEIRDTIKFHVNGDKVEIKIGDLSMKGTFTVDESKKPKTVDIKLEGGDGFAGIYEVNGNKVKFCLAVNDKDVLRPKEFKSEASSGHKLVVLKRAPETKKTDEVKKAEAPSPQRRVALMVFGGSQDKDAMKAKNDKDLELFQGTWQLVSMTDDGMKKDGNETAQVQVIVKGDKISINFEGKGEVKHAAFKLDSSKQPKQIDIFPEMEGIAKVVGIYELTGDTVKICTSDMGPRPTTFKSEAGGMLTLLELKRSAAKKDEIKKATAEQSPDLERIAGLWKLLKARGNGEDAPADFVRPVRLTFNLDGTVNVEGTPQNGKGVFKIDAEAQPKQITLTTAEKNETVPGIYKFDGDKLVLCLAETGAGSNRPQEFAADKGMKQIVFVLEQIQTARQIAQEKIDAIEVGDRRRSANHLSQIGRAMHLHHDSMKHLPAHAIYSKDGKTPLLSWRVALLPYIQEGALYREFKLDEPWDSEHNKKLIAKMPKVYEPVGLGSKGAGFTYYQVVTGADTVFDGAKTAKMPGSFPDGTSNTVLVVEAKDPVIWTKPEDLVLPKKGEKMPELGGMFNTGMNLLLCDASVLWVRKDIEPATLRAIVTPNGGEVVDLNSLQQQPPAMMKKDGK